MADLDVTLTIGSQVGFRRSSTQTLLTSVGSTVLGGINSPLPLVTTLLYLNGNIGTEPPFPGTRILEVSTTTPFVMAPGATSDSQTINITNAGSTSLSILSYVRSQDGATLNVESITPSSGVVTPGNTGTLTISYTGGPTLGEFYNYLLLVTNADNPQFKLITNQIITDQFLFQITATNYSTSTSITAYGEAFDAVYTLEATLDSIVLDPSLITYSGFVVAGAGWEVLGPGSNNNEFLVRFDSNNVNDTDGVYSSNITITGTYGGFSDTITTVNTATVGIDATKFKNLSYWISPASNYNSVIGASYDIINGIRYLTIGVGTGANGTPTYDQGGDSYVSVITLGIKAGPLAVRNNPYLGWANVWRFPISGAAATYYSNATDDGNNYLYKQKTTSNLDYEYYFGSDSSTGCMFIIEHDGEGNVGVFMNGLRELSGDPTFDTTLDNLTRAFYYYSEADGVRYTGPYAQPTNLYPPILAYENQTNVFRGFRFNQLTAEAQVDTYLAPYPV